MLDFISRFTSEHMTPAGDVCFCVYLCFDESGHHGAEVPSDETHLHWALKQEAPFGEHLDTSLRNFYKLFGLHSWSATALTSMITGYAIFVQYPHVNTDPAVFDLARSPKVQLDQTQGTEIKLMKQDLHRFWRSQRQKGDFRACVFRRKT